MLRKRSRSEKSVPNPSLILVRVLLGLLQPRHERRDGRAQLGQQLDTDAWRAWLGWGLG